MSGLDAGSLNRRVSFWRYTPVDDGTATVPGQLSLIGARSCKKTDVSDGERLRAAEQGQELNTRFVVRADALTRSITGKDVLQFRNAFYAIAGTKEVGRNFEGIEIAATARPDQAGG